MEEPELMTLVSQTSLLMETFDRRCGAIEDVDCTVNAAPCLQPSEDHGFVIDEAEVTFWGICPRCQNAEHP